MCKCGSCAHNLEFSCPHCQRRYRVEDHKIGGRRARAQCKCGAAMIIDGRALSEARLPEELRLSPKPPIPSTLAGHADAQPPASSEPTLESGRRSVGRITLRRVPADRLTPAPMRSETPGSDAERSRRIAQDRSDLEGPDAAASDLSSALSRYTQYAEIEDWEDTPPPSRQVSAPGEEPEVTVHYPVHWRPPPSEIRRLREAATARWRAASPAPSEPFVVSLERDASNLGETTSATQALEQTPRIPSVAERPTATSPDDAAPRRVAAHEPVSKLVHAPGRPALDSLEEILAQSPEPTGARVDSTAPAAIDAVPQAARAPRPRVLAGTLAAAGVLGFLITLAAFPGTGPQAPMAGEAPQQALGPREPTPERPSPALPGDPLPQAAPAPPQSTTQRKAIAGVGVEQGGDTRAAAPGSRERKAIAEVGAEQEEAAQTTPATVREGPRMEAPAPNPDVPDARKEAQKRADAPAAQARAGNSEADAPPGDQPQSSGTPRELDIAAVRVALGGAAAGARSCTEADGPRGNGSVRVLLDPAGGVLRVDVLGAPFQGTSTGACIAARFKAAATPSYAGRTQSTVVSFTLP